ncbi:hypothetical protein ACK8HJ_10100 [Vreelandella titanicae]|uniref:DNA breaking-rejoining enzyme, catalytic core n=1 Tax=Vreelandella titanicae BH1 TaxID=1204738 RepID=L9UCR8_9GAMM|nr:MULTISPECIES: DNA breaking-rejoining enzyme, catalytic core [Halomonas]ELY22679.1 DNA breaking-rejoining enzyme, catalytic core [Halomonas titanicae BH1]MCE7521304.1 hypothetical protein [Halomonas titanicae]CEP34042.1 DNA breaking-rejoining enzyme, catalytic core [Halomonas sp. R57-5]
MTLNVSLTLLLEDAIQPRADYFSFSQFSPALIATLQHLIIVGDDCWDLTTIRDLISALENQNIEFQVESGKGEKGIYGTNPIHGALYNISKHIDTEDRLQLLAHIINAAFQWRKEIEALAEHQSLSADDKKRLNMATYQKNLEAACKVARRMDADRLARFAPWDQSTHELLKSCQTLAGRTADGGEVYVQELERFFAYALNDRQPRKNYRAEQADNDNYLLPQRTRPLDVDPDEPWLALSSSVITFPSQTADYSTIRKAGLSAIEERSSIELIQSDKPLALAKGDSSLQSVFRARSQQLHLDKSAQLLPGRWEQLTAYDLHHLHAELNRTEQNHDFLKCILGLMLMTGRSLESVLDAHVIKRVDQVPKTSLHAQSLYLLSDSTSWITGVIRPPDSRQLSSQWRHAMRNTQAHLVLPIPAFLQPLVDLLTRHRGHRVRKRAVTLFPDQFKQQFTSELKKLLANTNKKTGSRLTVHRLGMHLFNTLNSGDADLTAACLITARVPSFGQQASLYYFAPSNHYLIKRYQDAMRVIQQQWPKPKTEKGQTTADSKYTAVASDSQQQTAHYVGSQLVPTSAYVEKLITHMQQQLMTADQSGSLFQRTVSVHNSYTAYTLAMLMFCTGYRSIRDPLPKWNQLSLSRRMMVIADKTDDAQSHARFLPLPSIMVQQLQHYLRHREAIVSRLQLYLQQAWESPFLFLDTYGHPKQVTPKRLQEHLDWPGSPPLNINRHFLHTQLKESGCSSELVDAYMGHWDAGQEPWAKYSTFCPLEYREHISSAIESIMQHQGWKAIEGAVL